MTLNCKMIDYVTFFLKNPYLNSCPGFFSQIPFLHYKKVGVHPLYGFQLMNSQSYHVLRKVNNIIKEYMEYQGIMKGMCFHMNMDVIPLFI